MTNQTPSPQTMQAERRGPPMPGFLFKLVNPLMTGVLRSPLHTALSERLMLLTFTGRKSSKTYTTPVGYLLKGNDVVVLNHSGWWRNFQVPAPVTVRIKGQEWKGVARLVSDPVEIKTIIQDLYAARGAEMAQRLGYGITSLEASPEAIAGQLQDTHFIAIRLEAK